jgi:flagellar biosynthesis GTPase FlhF
MLGGTATTNQTKDRAHTHGHQPTYLGGGAPGNMMSTWQSGSESDPRRQAQVQRTQGRVDISTSHQVSPTPDESEIQKNAEMEKQQANLEKQLKELKEREENMRKRENEMQEQAALVNMQQQEVMKAMQPSEPSNLLTRGKGKGKGKGKGSMPPSGMGAQVQHHHYVQHPPGNVTPQGYRIDQHQQINDVHRRRENYLVTQSHRLEAQRLQELTLAGFNEEIRDLERTPPAGHWPRSAAPAARYWQQMPQGGWMRWDDTHGECDPDTYNQDNFF